MSAMMDLRLFMKDFTLIVTYGKLVGVGEFGVMETPEPKELYHKIIIFYKWENKILTWVIRQEKIISETNRESSLFADNMILYKGETKDFSVKLL